MLPIFFMFTYNQGKYLINSSSVKPKFPDSTYFTYDRVKSFLNFTLSPGGRQHTCSSLRSLRSLLYYYFNGCLMPGFCYSRNIRKHILACNYLARSEYFKTIQAATIWGSGLMAISLNIFLQSTPGKL